MQFLMGLDDIITPIRSSLLTREILPEVKDAFVIVVREESHKRIPLCGIPPTSIKSDKPQASVFVSRTNDNRKNNGNGNWNNVNMNNGNKGNYNSLLWTFVGNNEIKTSTSTLSFTNDQVLKLMNLLNYKFGSTAHANMAVNYHFGWIVDSMANQHMTNNTKNTIPLVDITDLKLTVRHTNSTLAKITHIGNLRLNNNVVLSNVLVVLKYFDLKKERIMRTGSESDGLYMFDVDCDKFFVSNQTCLGELVHLDNWRPYKVISREGFRYFLTVVDDFSRLPSFFKWKIFFSLVYGREPNLSHLRSLGCFYFAAVVKGFDKFSKKDVKFYEIVFPYKMSNNTESFKSSESEVSSLNFFDNIESETAAKDLSSRPEDDEEGPSGRDGNVHQPWNQKLSKAFSEAGFVQSKIEHSLFVKNTGIASLFLLFYVNDLVIIGTDEKEIENFKLFLSNKFKIKDLGELKYFLGSDVLKTKIGLCLSQRKYCLELLYVFGLLACKPVMTPLPENIILAHKESDDDKSSAETEYRSMVSVTCEIIWIVKVMKDLNVEKLIPANLFCDNKSTIQISANPVMHEKIKHFDIDVHSVREKVSPGLIKTVKVDSKENC
ncbi:ribonuclease H-like domain-containing protein [Tanacetum coccineum]